MNGQQMPFKMSPYRQETTENGVACCFWNIIANMMWGLNDTHEEKKD